MLQALLSMLIGFVLMMVMVLFCLTATFVLLVIVGGIAGAIAGLLRPRGRQPSGNARLSA